MEIYTELIKGLYESSTSQEKSEVSLYKKQLADHSEKITKARELLLSGALDAADYRIVKNESERQITILEGKLLALPSQERGLGPLLNQAAKNLSVIRERYQLADVQEKRSIISSIYPENLTFDGSEHRTTRLNQAICVFDSFKGVFDGKKEGKSSKKLDLPTKVTPLRLELRTHRLRVRRFYQLSGVFKLFLSVYATSVQTMYKPTNRVNKLMNYNANVRFWRIKMKCLRCICHMKLGLSEQLII